MKTITHPVDQELSYPFSIPYENILFFDIETTGFSPDYCALYLIGALYYDSEKWTVIQWFADDFKSEKALLEAFLNFSKNYTHLIHFNGTGFDLPFLEKKCKAHHIDSFSSTLGALEQVDLYKAIFPFKKKLVLENFKQKTIEDFLGIHRTDRFSGKELISVYQNYMKETKKDLPEVQEMEELLLLHNRDDLIGMLQFSSLLSFVDLLNGETCFQQVSCQTVDSVFLLEARLPFSFLESYVAASENFYLQIQQNTIQLAVPILHRELKYFYPNPKDYYYLPEEDQAIHKSVSSFVEKSFRQKATKDNCYIRKQDHYIPFFGNQFCFPLFYENTQKGQPYIQLSKELLETPEHLLSYLSTFLQNANDLHIKKEA